MHDDIGQTQKDEDIVKLQIYENVTESDFCCQLYNSLKIIVHLNSFNLICRRPILCRIIGNASQLDSTTCIDN